LFAIAAAAAAFYFLLPRLAQVGSSWQGVLSADWAWLPLIIVLWQRRTWPVPSH